MIYNDIEDIVDKMTEDEFKSGSENINFVLINRGDRIPYSISTNDIRKYITYIKSVNLK